MRTRTTGMAIAVTVLISTACSSAMAQALELRASRSKVIALEHAWNQAEERKDVNALDQIMDDSLVYTDYDGAMMSKPDFLASVKAPARHPEQNVTESMDAHVYGDGAVVIGVYRVKGAVNGKPYLRRGRFTDTWIKRNGTWLCVASQNTLISH
jgi:ketosteroid isomerase-like protein